MSITSGVIPDSLAQSLDPSVDVIDSTKLSTYIECPRKFFYQHVMGWQPLGVQTVLVFGQAWHKALELLMSSSTSEYTEDLVEAAFEQGFMPVFRGTEEVFPRTVDRARSALLGWSRQWFRDLEFYEVLAVERLATLTLLGDYILFGKLDAEIRDRETGEEFVLEHKTCSQSSDAWELRLQIGAYLAMTEHPVIVDELILLKNTGARGGRLFDFNRQTIDFIEEHNRSWHFDVGRWMERLAGDFNCLAACQGNWAAVLPWCFPRSIGSACNTYGKRCIYSNLCREPTTPDCHSMPPIGFTVRHWDPRQKESTNG